MYQKSLDLNPKDGEVYVRRAELFLSQNDKPAAASDVAKAKEFGMAVPPVLIEGIK